MIFCEIWNISKSTFFTEHEACNFIKIETLAQVFSYEFCEISKNTFSYRTSPVAASVHTVRFVGESFQKKCLNAMKFHLTAKLLKKINRAEIVLFQNVNDIIQYRRCEFDPGKYIKFF